jgi:glycine C-acetyltransferase
MQENGITPLGFLASLDGELRDLDSGGFYKRERVILSPQGAVVRVAGEGGDRAVINLCANNYLGLANAPELIEAAKAALDTHGFGAASVRFICGTLDVHRQLETALSAFLGHDDTIVFSSCFDANGGVFEALFGEGDAIISDALNHASIIDGIRLSKAQRFRYAHDDMTQLEFCLQQTKSARNRVIVTDGVFSMDGTIANLKTICGLAFRYGALVMVDDSHATGILGPNGRGSPEYCGVEGRIDILTGTMGKALGGASGGFVSGRRQIVDMLRQRARPYLFSNALAPAIAAASLTAIDLAQAGQDRRRRLQSNSVYFRRELASLGFTLRQGQHPIIPVMLGDAKLSAQFAARLLELGVYVVAFSFPVVPKGEARIRTQLSAAHTIEQLQQAVGIFAQAGRELGLISTREAG